MALNNAFDLGVRYLTISLFRYIVHLSVSPNSYSYPNGQRWKGLKFGRHKEQKMIFGKKWWDNMVFELNLERNLAHDLWFCDKNNGVTMVAPARHVERVRRAWRDMRKSGQVEGQMRVNVYLPEFANQILFFTDRPEFFHPAALRGSGYPVGNLVEFELFCKFFPVELHAMRVPLIRPGAQGKTGSLGRLDNPNHFDRVIHYANEVCQVST